jgi:plastocyanin
VTARPARFPLALSGLALAAGLTACAGTAAPDTAAGSSSAGTSPSSSASSPAGQRIEVQVSGGQVSGDTGRVPVAAGEHVTLVLTSDVADEVHVHGYDLEAELSPGQPTEIGFDATIPGVFEVELHEARTQLLSLQVG